MKKFTAEEMARKIAEDLVEKGQIPADQKEDFANQLVVETRRATLRFARGLGGALGDLRAVA